MTSLVGSRVERKEDKKFLTGKGRYTSDINLVHQTYAYFVRSPHARAKIVKVDIQKALKATGVVNSWLENCKSRWERYESSRPPSLSKKFCKLCW